MLRHVEYRTVRPPNAYPTTDFKPMAETDVHRNLMFEVIETLSARYADDPDVYVTGNLLLFYEQGNKRRHVSPDCFVVFGVPKGNRENYLMWEEGKGPDVVIEITSKTTRAEDVKKKYLLYQDVLGVTEYFLFDPLRDYLDPPMQGYRRVRDAFRPIKWTDGRLPSKVLGLHLERDDRQLRFWDSETGVWLPTPAEVVLAEREKAAAERDRADAAEGENARLKRELERYRRKSANGRTSAAGH
jgi:Uma2 family endonuclease